jgi:hypothetical protein
LYDRDVLLNAGGVQIASRTPSGSSRDVLRFTFKVQRSLSKEPNTAEISIWNLNAQTRALLQELNLHTVLEAGYVGSRAVIFSGELEYGSPGRDGTDWISTLQSADGGQQISQARVNLSFGGGTGVGTVLLRLAEELGLGLGNVAEKAREGSLRGAVTEYLQGIALNGGLGLSVQDGQVQLLAPLETLRGDAALLTQRTGLVGSPEAGEKGRIKARCLLQPDLIPGRRVRIESDQVTGFFKVTRSTFVGDTWGQDWYSDIEGKPL